MGELGFDEALDKIIEARRGIPEWSATRCRPVYAEEDESAEAAWRGKQK
jgi:hypothetical protein